MKEDRLRALLVEIVTSLREIDVRLCELTGDGSCPYLIDYESLQEMIDEL